MAKEDFCFTYYDGDALRDMSHMNRLERGAYNDLVLQQRKFGRMNLEQIKKILGKDFEECWPSVNLVLIFDEKGKTFHIDWLEESIRKMRTHAKHQSKRGKGNKKETETEPDLNQTVTEIKPNLNLKEDGNGNEDVIVLKNNKESVDFSDYELWTTDIIEGNDANFEQMTMHSKFKNVESLARSYLALLAQYPNKEPPDQHRFRIALIEHIRANQNGTKGKQPANIIEERKRKFESGP